MICRLGRCGMAKSGGIPGGEWSVQIARLAHRHIGQCGISSKHSTVHAANNSKMAETKLKRLAQRRRFPPGNLLLVKYMTRTSCGRGERPRTGYAEQLCLGIGSDNRWDGADGVINITDG